MSFYWVKTNRIIKKLFPQFIWEKKNNAKKVYLTFDDGPTSEITQWTLDQLKEYNAKATFFCIGSNIAQFLEIFKAVIHEGHTVANHTFNHLNGWKTDTATYIENVLLCQKQIGILCENSYLFRPPYGKLKRSQSKKLRELGYQIIMWDVLSADFDTGISKEKCLQNVLNNVQSGSIIIFHDSVKASKNLKYALPETLQFLKENDFECHSL
ncbi:MAG TPA: polysaccharide deacetylase family protein [Flavobacterium sp.]|jgi:peptidoglycan/xylan/chitin deacetylase (PgdA/CDA1 family)